MVTNLSNSLVDRTIDADGMVVCPGFIDTHSHDDAYFLINPMCDDKVRQGVTTDVVFDPETIIDKSTLEQSGFFNPER